MRLPQAKLTERDFAAERGESVVISTGAVDPKEEARSAEERAAAEARNSHRCAGRPRLQAMVCGAFSTALHEVLCSHHHALQLSKCRPQPEPASSAREAPVCGPCTGWRCRGGRRGARGRARRRWTRRSARRLWPGGASWRR